MVWYVVKLLVLLPLIGALIWGSLKLMQKMQAKYGGPPQGTKSVRIVETTMLSPTTLWVVSGSHCKRCRNGNRPLIMAVFQRENPLVLQ